MLIDKTSPNETALVLISVRRKGQRILSRFAALNTFYSVDRFGAAKIGQIERDPVWAAPGYRAYAALNRLSTLSCRRRPVMRPSDYYAIYRFVEDREVNST